MDLKEAERLIVQAVENPTRKVPTDDLALALATVLVRNGMLGMSLSQVTLNIVTTEGTDA